MRNRSTQVRTTRRRRPMHRAPTTPDRPTRRPTTGESPPESAAASPAPAIPRPTFAAPLLSLRAALRPRPAKAHRFPATAHPTAPPASCAAAASAARRSTRSRAARHAPATTTSSSVIPPIPSARPAARARRPTSRAISSGTSSRRTAPVNNASHASHAFTQARNRRDPLIGGKKHPRRIRFVSRRLHRKTLFQRRIGSAERRQEVCDGTGDEFAKR